MLLGNIGNISSTCEGKQAKNPICDWCKPEQKMPVTDKTDISFYLIFSRSPLYVTAQPIHPTSCVDPDPVKKNFGFESTIVK